MQAAVLGAGQPEDVAAIGWMVALPGDSHSGRVVLAELIDTNDFVSLQVHVWSRSSARSAQGRGQLGVVTRRMGPTVRGA